MASTIKVAVIQLYPKVSHAPPHTASYFSLTTPVIIHLKSFSKNEVAD